MATIVTRAGKGSPLTNAEVDANFTNLNTDLLAKQDALVSGTSIKTVNGQSVLGSGNIQIDGGVTSFNTRTGAITLSSGDVTTALGFTPYNATNPSSYITTAGARSALSFTAGSGAYNSTTGDITIPTNTTHLTNGSGYITESASITGNAATATTLQTARTIGGVSFDGTANIDLPGVNTTGNQNTTGTASNVTGIVAVANGGTGTATPSLVEGTNITITGTWPNQTINASGGSSFPSGTVMLFVQTAAPTGWTKSTTHNDKALRVVSGTASSGGTVAFETAFASQAVAGTVSTSTGSASSGGSVSGTTGGTSLTLAQTAAHAHNTQIGAAARGVASGTSIYSVFASGGGQVSATVGSGSTHTHSFSASVTGTSHSHSATSTFTGTAIDLDVQYVDVIIATKD